SYGAASPNRNSWRTTETGPRRAPDASSASSSASAPSNRPSAHSRSKAAPGSSGAAGITAPTSPNENAAPPTPREQKRPPPAAALLGRLLRVKVRQVVREHGLEVTAQAAASRIQPVEE